MFRTVVVRILDHIHRYFRPERSAMSALITIREVGDITVINCTENRIVDEMVIHDWGQQLFSLVENNDKTRLVLSFQDVEFLSSAALGKLITLEKKVRAADGLLALCNVAPVIWKAFEMTGLNKKFKCYETEIDALGAI
jgi:anti-sigma B factor antagonist